MPTAGGLTRVFDRFHQQFLSFNDRHISHLQSLSFNERHVFLSGGTGEEVGIWQGGGSTAARRRGLAREPVKGTKRVQLVRRDGRDVSTLYGRERGGANVLLERPDALEEAGHACARRARQRLPWRSAEGEGATSGQT